MPPSPYGTAWYPWVCVVGESAQKYPGFEDVTHDFGETLYTGTGTTGAELKASMSGFAAGLLAVKDSVELADFFDMGNEYATLTLRSLTGEQFKAALCQHMERMSDNFQMTTSEEKPDPNDWLDDDMIDFSFNKLKADELEVDEETDNEDEEYREIVGDLCVRYPALFELFIYYGSIISDQYEPEVEQEAAMAGMLAGLVILKDTVEIHELELALRP